MQKPNRENFEVETLAGPVFLSKEYNEALEMYIGYLENKTNEKTFTESEVLESLKTLWIKNFKTLNDEHERNGYFMVGFVKAALDKPSSKEENGVI